MADAVKRARQATASGDWQEAVRHWQEVVGRSSRKAPESAFADLARVYLKLRRYAEAEVAARQGLERYPGSPRCRIQLAEVASARANWREARELWQEALERLDLDTPALVYARLARAHRELGNLDEADRLVRDGLAKHPADLRCSREHAELAMRRGDWADAAQRWKDILRSSGPRAPRDAQARLAVAQRQLELQASGQSTQAQGAQAPCREPSCPAAKTIKRSKQPDPAAEPSGYRASAKAPEAGAPSGQAPESRGMPRVDARGEAPESSPHSQLARSHRLQGDLRNAERIAKEGLREHPGDVSCLVELIETAVARGQWKAAVHHCRALLRHAGHDAPESVHCRLAYSLRRLGDLTAATAAARKGLARYRRSSLCLMELAEIAMAQKQWQAVVQLCQKVLETRGGKAPEMAFVRSAGAHRHLRDLARAETIAKQGLDSYPGSVPCLMELAEIASARPDWTLAASRWEDVLKRRGAGAPEVVSVRLGQAYRQLRQFDKAEAIVARRREKHQVGLSCLVEYAEIATAAGDEAAAIQRWLSVLDRRLSKAPKNVQKKLGECATRAKAAGLNRLSAFVRGVHGSLDLCRPLLCANAYEAYRAVEALDPERAVMKFCEALQDTEPGFPREIWCGSFEKIARFYSGAPAQVTPPSRSDTPADPARRASAIKLCVGGTGWSGSGALYDYFREFHQVTATDKVRELSYIEGRNGLGRIPAVFNGNFKDYLLRLYTDSLLGLVNLDHIRSHTDLVEARVAGGFAFGAHAREIAEAVDMLIGGLIAAQRQASPDYDGLVAEFLDRVLQAETGISDGYILLDNWIHSANVEMIRVLANARLFAVFRDPRSQYVSAKYEGAKSMVADATEYITSYRRRMERFRLAHSKLKDPSRVTVVQFERFVSDQEYRDSLARDVGLDLNSRHQHSHFRPWESQRNVTIHETYPDQALMRRIERELPEYCMDLHTLKEEGSSLSRAG